MINMSAAYDVLIIGSGPAAYTAAIYAARASLRTVIFTGDIPGGQLLLTSEVENFPGFRNGILGPDLMEEMRAQAERFKVEMKDQFIDRIEPGKLHTVEVRSGEKVQAKTIIIATGAQARWLGLKNETRLMGRGISACATCDGYFFQDKQVVVVGGGDTAMEEALTLTKFASKVIVVHRRDELRASKIMQERAKSHAKIEFIWHSAVADVLGEDMVSGVELTNLQTNQRSVVSCSGLFVAIGHIPATDFIKKMIDLDTQGYVVVRNNVFTNIDGIFAAGDVADKRYRQAITAAADGCRAALEAEHFLSNQG